MVCSIFNKNIDKKIYLYYNINKIIETMKEQEGDDEMLLNNDNGYINFKKMKNAKYLVDKTEIIGRLNELVDTPQNYVLENYSKV